MQTTESPVKTRKILLIDDDEMIRVLLRETFWIYSKSDEATDITAVRSIEEGRRFLEESAAYPDVIFVGMALKIKHRDGSSSLESNPTVEFIKDVKLAHHETMVIVYSSHDEPELKERAVEAGADHYLIKGQFTPKELCDFVENL